LFGFNSLFATTLTIDIQKDSINQTSEIFFFTNRPYKKTKKGIQFKNKWKGYGLQIHFAAYNPNTDQYRLIQSLQYFEEDREELSERFWNQKEALNIIYKEILDSKKFDRVAIFIPGYSKTFEGQIKQFIPKLKSNYEGQAQNKTLFLTFAWAMNGALEDILQENDLPKELLSIIPFFIYCFKNGINKTQ
jgi:hypothetical protein